MQFQNEPKEMFVGALLLSFPAALSTPLTAEPFELLYGRVVKASDWDTHPFPLLFQACLRALCRQIPVYQNLDSSSLVFTNADSDRFQCVSEVLGVGGSNRR